jgi:hypothetical protein
MVVPSTARAFLDGNRIAWFISHSEFVAESPLNRMCAITEHENGQHTADCSGGLPTEPLQAATEPVTAVASVSRHGSRTTLSARRNDV